MSNDMPYPYGKLPYESLRVPKGNRDATCHERNLPRVDRPAIPVLLGGAPVTTAERLAGAVAENKAAYAPEAREAKPGFARGAVRESRFGSCLKGSLAPLSTGGLKARL
jgi:hypothetical protein